MYSIKSTRIKSPDKKKTKKGFLFLCIWFWFSVYYGLSPVFLIYELRIFSFERQKKDTTKGYEKICFSYPKRYGRTFSYPKGYRVYPKGVSFEGYASFRIPKDTG